MNRALGVLALIGCGGAAPTPPLASRTTRDEDARAYVLGRGVARDYRRAVGLYEQRCVAGCGDVAACDALLALVGSWRGRLPVVADITLARRACARGSEEGCAIEDLVWPPASRDAGERCRAGELAGCYVGILPMTTTRDDVLELAAIVQRACRAGTQRACRQLVVANRAEAADLAMLGAACDAGDADACGALPDRAIAPATLCAQGDLAACEEVRRSGGVVHSPPPGETVLDAAAAAQRDLRERCAAGDHAACARARKPPLPGC